MDHFLLASLINRRSLIANVFLICGEVGRGSLLSRMGARTRRPTTLYPTNDMLKSVQCVIC